MLAWLKRLWFEFEHPVDKRPWSVPMSYGFGGCYEDEPCPHGKRDWALCPICYHKNIGSK